MTDKKETRKLRPELGWFADQQEEILSQHDGEKIPWQKIPLGHLLNPLKLKECELQETAFVHGALQGLPKTNEMKFRALDIIATRLIEECCHVANYAMMIADKARPCASELWANP